MPDGTTNTPRLLRLAVASPLWLGALFLTGSSAAEPPDARARVPGIDAACRADASQRAHEARLTSVEWVASPAAPGAAADDAPAMTRIEIAGRARSAGGWSRLIARCTYAKGRPAAISLQLAPVPALDLSAVTRLPDPPRRQAANAPAAPAATSAPPEPAPSLQLKPTLKEAPFDPLTIGKRQDFLKDHLLGVKVQTPF